MTAKDINQIEETLAHQEQNITDLSDMVILQGREIERLRKDIQKLQGKIETMEDSPDIDGKISSVTEQAARDKPPHY